MREQKNKKTKTTINDKMIGFVSSAPTNSPSVSPTSCVDLPEATRPSLPRGNCTRAQTGWEIQFSHSYTLGAPFGGATCFVYVGIASFRIAACYNDNL